MHARRASADRKIEAAAFLTFLSVFRGSCERMPVVAHRIGRVGRRSSRHRPCPPSDVTRGGPALYFAGFCRKQLAPTGCALIASRRSRAMPSFDYNAEAELFPLIRR